MFGAASGQTQSTETAAEGVAAITTASGLGTLIATGSLDKATTAAAAEGIVTSNPKDLTSGGNLERAAKVLDLMQNIRRVEHEIKNKF